MLTPPPSPPTQGVSTVYNDMTGRCPSTWLRGLCTNTHCIELSSTSQLSCVGDSVCVVLSRCGPEHVTPGTPRGRVVLCTDLVDLGARSLRPIVLS